MAARKEASSTHLLGGEEGATTIEYTMVLGFMSVISIYAAIWLITVLQNTVAVLVIKMAIFLTGFPSS